jgi:major vault protein
MSSSSVIRLKPYHFLHITDKNTNVTRLVCGPQIITIQEHEEIAKGPEKMQIVPPRHSIKIRNPVLLKDNEPVYDENKNTVLRYGEEEIRIEPKPFPLYPGEEIVGSPEKLTTVQETQALKLEAVQSFYDDREGVERNAGDQWLLQGPATYYPRIEERVVQLADSQLIGPNAALKIIALQDTKDYSGNVRKAGEEWLVRKTGHYLPGINEQIVGLISGYILTDEKALNLEAISSFTDQFDVKRKAGERWLVTNAQTPVYIPGVYEQVVGEVKLTVLNENQYTFVRNPHDKKNGKIRYGTRELRRGQASFFLHPGEELESGIKDNEVLAVDETLLVRAVAEFKDGNTIRLPGSKWLVKGPCEYVPPVEVEVITKRKAIALDKNEGIYIRDLQTGKVSMISGQTYILKAHEELWEKNLPKEVEEQIALGSTTRDYSQVENVVSFRGNKSRVVSYRVPYNAATQIYDYSKQKARVVFGPQLINLGPNEEFTLLSLSGGNPKRPDVIKSLVLFLGPDFMTDVIVVETSDHARLNLKLAYNWRFRHQGNEDKIFQVPDFVGDACKAIASRIRGAVAQATFDEFHKESTQIIRKAVFGEDEILFFEANSLEISAVDVQSVEPIDQRTRDALSKSVQLAIEITTRSQEATAQHEAKKADQIANGFLETVKIEAACESEKEKTILLELQTQTATLEATGDQTSDAEAKRKAAEISGEAAVAHAQLIAQAMKFKAESELEQNRLEKELAYEYAKELKRIEVKKSKRAATIETDKFAGIVNAIGPKTIQAIAQAGPEMQAKLLKGLGLQGFMITDGQNPINLFNTANSLLGNN